MFEPAPYEPAAPEEIETVLTDAIRSSAGGQMTRNAEVFLAGVCAKHLGEGSNCRLAGLIAAFSEERMRKRLADQLFWPI